jgi:hypothetical protein
MTPLQELMQWFNERPQYDKTSEGYEIMQKAQELLQDERGNMVRLLRWVLKHYETYTDENFMFGWINPNKEEFNSIEVVDHYLNQSRLDWFVLH